MSENYSQELLDLLMTVLLTAFERYQEIWLDSHDEIKLSKAERDMISKFLKDSNKAFIKEHLEGCMLRGETTWEERE